LCPSPRFQAIGGMPAGTCSGQQICQNRTQMQGQIE
jgi:hypothetical protein